MKKQILQTLAFCLLATVSMNGQVVINEFMASNTGAGGIFDPDGGSPDWVEIYNNGSSAVNLGGYMLSDTIPEPTKFVFPAGTIIEADAYIIIWCDKDLDQEGFHADFNIKAEGEELYLFDDGGDVIDEIVFGQQESDVSFARIPNGTGDFEQRAPTHGYNNEANSVIGLPVEPEVSIYAYPNPASTTLSVDLKAIDRAIYKAEVQLVNAVGQVVFTQSFDNLTITDNKKDTIQMDISTVAQGLYFVVVKTAKGVATSGILVE